MAQSSRAMPLRQAGRVVAALYSRTFRDSHCMQLLRALAFIEAQHAFHLQLEYILGLITWQMTCRVITFLLSSQFPEHTDGPHHSHPHSSWIQCKTASSSSAKFPEQSGPIDKAVYVSALKMFYAFCTRFNVGDPFHVTEQLLCSYAAYLADAGLAPQSTSRTWQPLGTCRFRSCSQTQRNSHHSLY